MPRFNTSLAILAIIFYIHYSYLELSVKCSIFRSILHLLVISILEDFKGFLFTLKIYSKTLPRDYFTFYKIFQALIWSAGVSKRKESIYRCFEKQLDKRGKKTCVIQVETGRKWTYNELNEYANRIANYFKKEGFSNGDSITRFIFKFLR